MPLRSRLRLTALLLLTLLLPACSADSPTGDPPADEQPAVLSLAPAAGPPGTVFAISGLDLDRLDPGSLELRLGGLPGAVSLSPSGQLLGAVPLLAAGADGQSPPGAAQDLELLAAGALVGRAEAAFTVEALAAAPGSSAALALAFTGIGSELARLADALAPAPGAEEQWTLALAGALDDLINSDDPQSLSSALATLAAEEPATLALLDAFVAGSGLLAQTEALLAGFQAVALPSEREATVTEDVVLARKMQFYALAKRFGETVVGETAEEYAYTVGLATGLIGIGAEVPAAAVVGAVLAVADFAINKVLLGILPATVTGFTLTLEDPDLLMGQTTTARVDLSAANAPAGVGIQDFIGLTLTLIGLGANAQTETFTQVLSGTASFFLGLVQQLLSTYSAAHPELNLDIDVELVPAMSWTTTIHDPRLVDCLSLEPNLIAGLAEEVNWQAGTSQVGSTDIYARTAIGPEALLLDLLPGFSYADGAFGEDVVGTAPITVNVSGTLVMTVDFVEFIEPGDFEPVTAWVGYAVPGGDPLPAAGVHIEAIAEGGTVSPSSGATNGAGQFIAIASLDEGSNGIVITVTATDPAGSQASASVTANSSPAATVTVGWLTVFGSVSAAALVGPPDQGQSQNFDLGEQQFGPGSVTDSNSASAQVTSDGGASAAGQGSVSISGNGATTGDTFTASGSVSITGSGNYSLPPESDPTYGTAWGGGGGTGVFRAGFALATDGDLVDAEVHFSAGGGTDDPAGIHIAILRRVGGSSIAVLEDGGSWDGTLILPGSYEIELRVQGGCQAASGADEPLVGDASVSASGNVNCTVTLH